MLPSVQASGLFPVFKAAYEQSIYVTGSGLTPMSADSIFFTKNTKLHE